MKSGKDACEGSEGGGKGEAQNADFFFVSYGHIIMI